MLRHLAALTLFANCANAEPARALRPVHTYSIVARDPATGELGVAVQSHWFSVGTVVLWAESGVGAVATQSIVDPTYGPLGLDLMRAGKSASGTLRGLLATDPQAAMRQVAMVDARGDVAAHTGTSCIAEAGHHIGQGFSVQANLMRNDTVWPAMAKAYTGSPGDLADRLLAALAAAEAEGGDIRGRQSAAILVVAGTPSGKPWQDRRFDLRVEDHPDPVTELKRLVRLRRAYLYMDEGDEKMGKGDLDGAQRAYGAAEALEPENIEMVFWHAVALVGAKNIDAALPLFKRVFAGDPSWATLVPRLSRSGFLPDDRDLLDRILAVAPVPR